MGIDFLGMTLAAICLTAGFTWPLYRDFANAREKMKGLDAIKDNVDKTLQEVRQSVERFEEVLEEKIASEDVLDDLRNELEEMRKDRQRIAEEIEAVRKTVQEVPSLDAIASGVHGFDAVQAKAFERMKSRLDAVCKLELETNSIIQGILDRVYYLEYFVGISRGRGGSLAEAMFANRNPATSVKWKYEEMLKDVEGEDGSGK